MVSMASSAPSSRLLHHPSASAFPQWGCPPSCRVSFTSLSTRRQSVEPLRNSRGALPHIQAIKQHSEAPRLEGLIRDDTTLRIFSGTGNPALSQEIANYLGLRLGEIKIKRFADGEIYVQFQECVRGCDVFLVQPACFPLENNLTELLFMIDACYKASADNITAVIPYFSYTQADKKTQFATFVANAIIDVGASRMLACDLLPRLSEEHFDIPIDHVLSQDVILDYLKGKSLHSNDVVVVSPDTGSAARAHEFTKKLSDAPLAIVGRKCHGHNVAQDMDITGDVRGKVAVMVVDTIDTGGAIAEGAALLHEKGAREVYACCTHAILSPPAMERLSSGLFKEVIVTNTVPIPEMKYFPQLTILSVANLFGDSIWRAHQDFPASGIFR